LVGRGKKKRENSMNESDKTLMQKVLLEIPIISLVKSQLEFNAGL